jgi:hypothetical protein
MTGYALFLAVLENRAAVCFLGVSVFFEKKRQFFFQNKINPINCPFLHKKSRIFVVRKFGMIPVLGNHYLPNFKIPMRQPHTHDTFCIRIPNRSYHFAAII